MFRKYRIQPIMHTHSSHALLEIHDAVSESEEAAARTLGDPHGRPDLWAMVWSVDLGRAWLFDGMGRVTVVQDIRPRWGRLSSS